MKRFATFLTFSLLMGQWSMAQIANGSLAPNFTAVDLNGNSYTLHDILGSGRGVVIDFSTTWCGPCYAMHITHFFDRMHQNYGPQGTDELVVLFLEADNSTTLADLQGTGPNTVGDFTKCTDVPIIDNMQASSGDYQVSYVPAFYVINPADSTTRYFNLFTSAGMMAYMAGAGMITQPPLDPGMDYVCDAQKTRYICSQANTFVPQFELHNFGATTLTALSFDISVNGAFHSSQNWSGNLLSFQSEEVVLAPIPVSGNAAVTVAINQNGDGNLDNNTVVFDVQLSNASTLNAVTVEIRTDDFSEDTYWHIVDAAGMIVDSGGNSWVGTTNIGGGFGSQAPPMPPGTYQDNQTYTETVSLVPGNCYDFVITDYYGGGLLSMQGGGYKVMDHLGNVLFAGDAFEAIVTHPFLSAPVTRVDDPFADADLQLYPNPARDQLNLSMDVDQADITIVDLLGRQVYQAAWNEQPVSIAHLSSGLYTLKASAGPYSRTKRFVKE